LEQLREPNNAPVGAITFLILFSGKGLKQEFVLQVLLLYLMGARVPWWHYLIYWVSIECDLAAAGMPSIDFDADFDADVYDVRKALPGHGACPSRT